MPASQIRSHVIKPVDIADLATQGFHRSGSTLRTTEVVFEMVEFHNTFANQSPTKGIPDQWNQIGQS